MWLRGKGRVAGFSVVEMMVVVVIIGILAQLGLSRYRVMTAKSRQAEAKLNLNAIEELQEVYFLEHGKYQTGDLNKPNDGIIGRAGNCADDNLKNKLGFRPKDCAELRYTYDWKSNNTEATATSDLTDKIYPGCEETDKWKVTYNKGKITNEDNVIDKCK